MPDRSIRSQLREAAAGSPEHLSCWLFELISMPRLVPAGKDTPPEVSLLRELVDPELDDLGPRLSTALAVAAATWSLGLLTPAAAFVGTSLLAHFSSPSIAKNIAVRLLAPAPQASKLRGDGSFDDLLIGTVMGALYDPVVRAQLVELLRLSAYRRFAITAMIRLAKHDLTTMSTVSQIAMGVAQEQLAADHHNFAYMIGFDAHLNASDIHNITKSLPAALLPLFMEMFVFRSKRFVVLPDELRAFYSRVSRRGTIIVDIQNGSSVWLPISDSHAISSGGRFTYNRTALLSELNSMGLTGKPLAA